MSARRLTLALALLGLAVAVYLSAVHFSQASVPLLCSASGLVNCETVTTSPESMVGPVPVAALGIVWFVVLLGLLAWRDPSSLAPAVARLAWSTAGLLTVFYLIYAELVRIGAICLWCSVVHVTVIALFLIQLAQVSGGGIELTDEGRARSREAAVSRAAAAGSRAPRSLRRWLNGSTVTGPA